MGWTYLVLAGITALGLALGWRLTPASNEREPARGLARILQLGIALIGLLLLTALLVPWFVSLDQIACTPASERAGACILGLEDQGLFGVCAFVCLVAVAFAFILRKGVLDFPPAGPAIEDFEGGVGDFDTILPTREHHASSEAAEAPAAAEPAPAQPDTEAESGEAPQDDASDSEPAEATQTPESDPESAAALEQAPHRRLEGPVFRAFVDDDAVDLELAIRTAVERLGSERVAVVFSRGASKGANVALLALSEALEAHRYVLEGTAAATEGLPSDDAPDPSAVDELAGPHARHAGELALDLAGSFIQTVFLLDTRVAFPEFVLGKLTQMQSVCIAHAHDDVSGACQVVLPGTNPGEREGELVDSDGGANSRRTREWLVGRLVAALEDLQKSSDDSSDDTTDTGDTDTDTDTDTGDAPAGDKAP